MEQNTLKIRLKKFLKSERISLLNVAEVRDQARHSSISITDVYTDRTKHTGNEHIKSLDFKPGM